MTNEFPQRKYTAHEICTQDDLNFLAQWMKVLFELSPEARKKANSVSIMLTGKFVGIDPQGILSVEKVEKWNKI